MNRDYYSLCCDDSHGQNYAKYSYKDNTYQDGKLISSVAGQGDLGYSCGLCIDRKAAEQRKDSTATTIKCGYSEGLNGYDLGCGKTTESIEAYTPGCGLSDGQITGAHILYDQASGQMKLEESAEQEQSAKGVNALKQPETTENTEVLEIEKVFEDKNNKPEEKNNHADTIENRLEDTE